MATVLLVEDDHVVRGAMLRSLADRGHAVHAVGTALEALRRVAAETPDLVVLDLGLPDLDGSDALRMLRDCCEWKMSGETPPQTTITWTVVLVEHMVSKQPRDEAQRAKSEGNVVRFDLAPQLQAAE